MATGDLRKPCRAIIRLLFLALFAGLQGAPARAADLSFVAGTDFTSFDFASLPSGASQNPRPGLAFGGLLDIGLAGPLELEPGLIFVLRRPELDLPNGTAEPSTLRSLQIPLLLRVTTFDWLSLGFGGYYAQGFERVQANTAVAFSANEPGYAGSNLSKIDYGMLASVQLRVPITHDLRIIADGRYLNGMNNVDQTGTDPTYFREFQAFLGMTFGTFH